MLAQFRTSLFVVTVTREISIGYDLNPKHEKRMPPRYTDEVVIGSPTNFRHLRGANPVTGLVRDSSSGWNNTGSRQNFPVGTYASAQGNQRYPQGLPLFSHGSSSYPSGNQVHPAEGSPAGPGIQLDGLAQQSSHSSNENETRRLTPAQSTIQELNEVTSCPPGSRRGSGSGSSRAFAASNRSTSIPMGNPVDGNTNSSNPHTPERQPGRWTLTLRQIRNLVPIGDVSEVDNENVRLAREYNGNTSMVGQPLNVQHLPPGMRRNVLSQHRNNVITSAGGTSSSNALVETRAQVVNFKIRIQKIKRQGTFTAGCAVLCGFTGCCNYCVNCVAAPTLAVLAQKALGIQDDLDQNQCCCGFLKKKPHAVVKSWAIGNSLMLIVWLASIVLMYLYTQSMLKFPDMVCEYTMRKTCSKCYTHDTATRPSADDLKGTLRTHYRYDDDTLGVCLTGPGYAPESNMHLQPCYISGGQVEKVNIFKVNAVNGQTQRNLATSNVSIGETANSSLGETTKSSIRESDQSAIERRYKEAQDTMTVFLKLVRRKLGLIPLEIVSGERTADGSSANAQSTDSREAMGIDSESNSSKFKTSMTRDVNEFTSSTDEKPLLSNDGEVAPVYSDSDVVTKANTGRNLALIPYSIENPLYHLLDIDMNFACPYYMEPSVELLSKTQNDRDLYFPSKEEYRYPLKFELVCRGLHNRDVNLAPNGKQQTCRELCDCLQGKSRLTQDAKSAQGYAVFAQLLNGFSVVAACFLVILLYDMSKTVNQVDEAWPRVKHVIKRETRGYFDRVADDHHYDENGNGSGGLDPVRMSQSAATRGVIVGHSGMQDDLQIGVRGIPVTNSNSIVQIGMPVADQPQQGAIGIRNSA